MAEGPAPVVAPPGRDLKCRSTACPARRVPPAHKLESRRQAPLAKLADGEYQLVVEAAREDGGREVVRIPFQWPPKADQALKAPGQHELGASRSISSSEILRRPNMRNSLKWSLLALCFSLPVAAQAHRVWMLPSATILSGDDQWVTIDAAVSNDLFYFEHYPLQIASIGKPPAGVPAARGARPAHLTITAPDGSRVEAQNGNMGRYRSSFDVHVTQNGTYKIAVLNEGVFANWKVGGETKRWRGDARPSPRKCRRTRRSCARRCRTAGWKSSSRPASQPRDTLKTSGTELELDPVTHPNDLVAGAPATFRLLLDGKPAPDLKVTVVPGGNRYRDKLGEMTLTTDKDGKFSVTWPEAGMYWMEAVARDDKTEVQGVKERRAGYVATLEVLPQ